MSNDVKHRILPLSELRPTTRRLILARGLRSFGQGALVVDFALYLDALGWNGVAIGVLLSAAGLLGGFLSLLTGVLSDRVRRRPFLLFYEAVSLVAGTATLLSANAVVITIAAILVGYGRGANGAAGPFSPAEQSWLAEEVDPRRRGQVYSINAAVGFLGMGLGALIGMLPSFLHTIVGSILAYRLLFLLVVVPSAINLVLFYGTHENYRGPSTKVGLGAAERAQEGRAQKQENRLLRRLMFVNAFNGLAIGLTGPLISYWFALKFQVGPSYIAPVIAASFLLTAKLSILTGRITRRAGIVRPVVVERLVGLILYAILPLIPVYWLASLIYLLRTVFSRGPAGAQQALTMGLVREHRRGLAASLNVVSFLIPRSVGPGFSGYLLDLGLFGLPFYLAAALQSVYLVGYARFFRKYEPPPESEGPISEDK
ncbi:MAG: MFS transporter [Planctomycetes bacterium]|nr:MFS transporter [Planctomycetota bacterium]